MCARTESRSARENVKEVACSEAKSRFVRGGRAEVRSMFSTRTFRCPEHLLLPRHAEKPTERTVSAEQVRNVLMGDDFKGI